MAYQCVPDYRIQRGGKKFFRIGKVFSVAIRLTAVLMLPRSSRSSGPSFLETVPKVKLSSLMSNMRRKPSSQRSVGLWSSKRAEKVAPACKSMTTIFRHDFYLHPKSDIDIWLQRLRENWACKVATLCCVYRQGASTASTRRSATARRTVNAYTNSSQTQREGKQNVS